MPLFISPASAHRATPVTLTNTLGHPIVFRVTLSRCNGHTSYTSGPLSLANDGRYTVPSGGPRDPAHRVVTFTVQGSGGQVAASASLTSDQGCTAAGVAKARTSALTAPRGHTGSLAVTAAQTSGTNGVDLIGALVIVVLAAFGAVAIWRRRKSRKVVQLIERHSHRVSR